MASKLKAVKPEKEKKRLKLLLFGPAGIGKTMAGLGFPRPYVIDTEKGATENQYVDLINKNGGVWCYTTDIMEIIDQVTGLYSEKHNNWTLVIDPINNPYAELREVWAEKVGTEWAKDKGPTDRTFKHLLSLILKLDMNVVMTAHAKKKWIKSKDQNGKEVSIEAGLTFDGYDKMDYPFDLVLEAQKRGGERIAIVRKSRIEAFPEGSEFPLSYDEIANRYGRDILEREAIPVELATQEQVDELTRLLEVRTDGETLKEKWLKKAEAEDVTELPKDIADKCIAYLKEGKKE